MDDQRRIDPRSWHGGARVAEGGGGKWIVQKFKELEAGNRVGVDEWVTL